jgi:hypothetical protein
MGDEQDPPIVLGRPFLNTTRAIIYIRTCEIHFQFRTEKERCYFNTYTNPEQPKKNKTRRRLQRLQHKLNTKLINVKNIEEEIKEKSAQLLPAQHSEPVTPERSPPKKQVWRKKDQSTPSKTIRYPRHRLINQWTLHLRHGSKYSKLSPIGNSVFIFIFCIAYLD